MLLGEEGDGVGSPAMNPVESGFADPDGRT